jgi:uncharacterized protein YlxP (DUF503 family)
MIVGVLRLELSLPASRSLKDKRRVLQSLLDRLHQQFNVAAAEIDHQDDRRRAEIAVSCVSNDGVHANRVLSHALDLVEREADVVLTGVEMELR